MENLLEKSLKINSNIESYKIKYSKEVLDNFLNSKNLLQHLTEISSISSRYLVNDTLQNIYIINLLKLHLNISELLNRDEIKNIIVTNIYTEEFLENLEFLKIFELEENPWIKYVANRIGMQCLTVSTGLWSKKVNNVDYSVSNLVKKFISISKVNKPSTVFFFYELFKLDVLILIYFNQIKDFNETLEKNLEKIFYNVDHKLGKQDIGTLVRVVPSILDTNELSPNNLFEISSNSNIEGGTNSSIKEEEENIINLKKTIINDNEADSESDDNIELNIKIVED